MKKNLKVQVAITTLFFINIIYHSQAYDQLPKASHEISHVGFICPAESEQKTHDKIFVKRYHESIIVGDKHGNILVQNHALILPSGSDTESFQKRYWIYHTLAELSMNHMPYRPGFLLMYHVMRSQRSYKRSFKAFEGKQPPVHLSRMYCRMFIEAIKSFQ